MPGALPRGVRAEEVIAAFEKAGGERRGGKGSHVNIKMPNGQLVTMPARGAIKCWVAARCHQEGRSYGAGVCEIGGEVKMDYTVLIHRAQEGGYWTEVPGLPGCYSQGETIEEALVNTREAVECHLAGLREEGQEIVQEGGLLIARVSVAE